MQKNLYHRCLMRYFSVCSVSTSFTSDRSEQPLKIAVLVNTGKWIQQKRTPNPAKHLRWGLLWKKLTAFFTQNFLIRFKIVFSRNLFQSRYFCFFPNAKSSCSQMFYKRNVLKNFTKLTEASFLIKLQRRGLQLYQK